MNKRLFPLMLALTATLFSTAQEKRALLIAIDNYEAPATYTPSGTGRSLFRNLDGCVNDALEVGRPIDLVLHGLPPGRRKAERSSWNVDGMLGHLALGGGRLSSHTGIR